MIEIEPVFFKENPVMCTYLGWTSLLYGGNNES